MVMADTDSTKASQEEGEMLQEKPAPALTKVAAATANAQEMPQAAPGACVPCAKAKSGKGKTPSRVPSLTPQQADQVLLRALKNQAKLLNLRKAQIQRWNAKDQRQFKKWFGNTDQASRDKIVARIDKELALNKSMTLNNFKRAPTVEPGTFAYVCPNDASHTIYIDGAFAGAPGIGQDSQAGTLAHEMSHFTSVGGTQDYVYGSSAAQKLAKQNPAKALDNADSFEYFIEGVR